MTGKYPFIRAVSIVLRIIWYLQWVFLLFLIIAAILIASNSSLINLNKLKGFKIQFEKIELGQNNSNSSMAQSNAYLSNGVGRLHLQNTDDSFIFFRLISVFADTILYVFIIYLLQKIFKSLKTGTFFIRRNGIYIKRIAYAVLGIALLPDFINYLINIYIADKLNISGIVFKASYNFDLRTTFLALLIFVIAKVFIRGAELKEDHDLTI